MTSVSVVGLGRLGTPWAAMLAAHGFDVLGVDIDPAAATALEAGTVRWAEPGLQELLDAGRGRLRATTDLAAAAAADVSFLVLPTPAESDGAFGLAHVLAAVTGVGSGLRGHSEPHVMAIVSTVMPGSTEGPIRAALQDASGRSVGPDLGLCANPSFVALGSVVRDMHRPPLVLVGASDERAADAVEAVHRGVIERVPEVHRVAAVDAELVKLLVSTFVTTKISYANMVSEVCAGLPGANAGAVTAAVGADPRIGHGGFLPGTPYGGPCFPRDNAALAALAAATGVDSGLATATEAVNDRQLERLLGDVRAALPADGTVAVLGLAYKPGTDVTERSTGMALVATLAAGGVRVLAADPVAAPSLPAGVRQGEPADVLAAADVAVLATPWAAFADLDWDRWRAGNADRVLVDPWRLVAG